MTDFEVAIINASMSVTNTVHCCFFHLCQSVYRYIHHEGHQVDYLDPETRIKETLLMMCSSVFVPVDEAEEIFEIFYENTPVDFHPIADYFKVYIYLFIFSNLSYYFILNT